MISNYILEELKILNKMHNMIHIPKDVDEEFILRVTIDLIDQLVYENRELKRKLRSWENGERGKS